MSDDDFYEAIFLVLKSDFVDGMHWTLPRLKAYARVEDSLRVMAAPYRPTGSVSQWDCFRANPEAYFNASPEEWRTVRLGQWGDFCQSPVQYYDIDGDHHSCIRPPHLDRLQIQLNRALAARNV